MEDAPALNGVVTMTATARQALVPEGIHCGVEGLPCGGVELAEGLELCGLFDKFLQYRYRLGSSIRENIDSEFKMASSGGGVYMSFSVYYGVLN